MTEANLQYVLLYRTADRWRITVCDRRDGIACGALHDTPADAPVEVAQHEVLQQLRRHWRFQGRLIWEQTEPDWWAAEPIT